MAKDSYARCVRHAAGLMGGTAALAERLGVAPELVNRWTSGAALPAAAHFSRIVDIIIGKTGRPRPARGA